MKVPLNVFRDITIRSLRSLGHSKEDAELITNVIQYAELRGNNQGIIKIVGGALVPDSAQGEISIVHETPVSARLDGGMRIGMVVVGRAVEIAINKAKNSGISVVGVSGYASATGALGMWARQLTDAGLIGIVLSQCSEMVSPFGSFEPIFGTNPIAIGIPSQPRAQILDMATSATAYYGLKLAEAAGQPIPSDVAYDAQGQPTTSAADALRGAIRVFDRGIKGSHLALMVELLAGAFTGAAMEDKLASRNWGSLVLAISPSILGDEASFLQSVDAMCARVKAATPLPDSPPGFEMLLPGERGDRLEKQQLDAGELEVDERIFAQLREIAGMKDC